MEIKSQLSKNDFAAQILKEGVSSVSFRSPGATQEQRLAPSTETGMS